MTNTMILKAERREPRGKGGARSTRRAGRVPGVIYGHGREPEPLSIAAQDLEKLIQSGIGSSTVIELALGDTTVPTLIREVQRHPVRHDVTHIDFYEIHAGETVDVDVPVRLVGVPDGVRNAGGVLEQFLREVRIEVLPKDIPDHVDVDVTALVIGASLHVSDLTIPNAKVLTEAGVTVCTVVPPRVEEVVVPAAEAEIAEPELIRKPREEEEEAEGGEESQE
jgi:large subunit ribosomal protein L25